MSSSTLKCFCKRVSSSCCESISGRVNNMSSSFLKYIPYTYDRISSLWAFLNKFMKCFFNSCHILGWDRCSCNFTNKLTFRFCLFWLNRLNVSNNSSILSSSSCLFFMKVIESWFFCYSLSIIYTWVACFHLHSELSLYSLYINL